MAGASKHPELDEVEMYLATRLRVLRLAAGLSQEKAAAVIGLSFQQIQKYEKGQNHVRLSYLLRLSAAYGTTLEGLLDGAPGIDGSAEKPGLDLATQFLAMPRGIDIARTMIELKNGHREVVHSVAAALAGRA